MVLFDAVVLSDEADSVKPDVKTFQLMVKKLGVSHADCLVVDKSASIS